MHPDVNARVFPVFHTPPLPRPWRVKVAAPLDKLGWSVVMLQVAHVEDRMNPPWWWKILPDTLLEMSPLWLCMVQSTTAIGFWGHVRSTANYWLIVGPLFPCEVLLTTGTCRHTLSFESMLQSNSSLHSSRPPSFDPSFSVLPPLDLFVPSPKTWMEQGGVLQC